jgi:hypothetical protein
MNSLNTQSSVEPFPRPDHRAKKHGRPKPKAWHRRVVRRQCELAIARELGVMW